MTSLATPAQLGAFMQESITDTDPTALLMLDIASGMVRDHLQMQGYAVDPATADVVYVDPVDGRKLFLDGLPISTVTLVETFDGTAWTTADPKTYTVSRRLGIISALPWTGVTWPDGPETWRVTYTHGFPTLPSTILGVVLGVAARAYASPVGVDLERIGGYQIKYSMEADGFSGIEKRALAAYTNPRVA
jgi:hypothetical protein